MARTLVGLASGHSTLSSQTSRDLPLTLESSTDDEHLEDTIVVRIDSSPSPKTRPTHDSERPAFIINSSLSVPLTGSTPRGSTLTPRPPASRRRRRRKSSVIPESDVEASNRTGTITFSKLANTRPITHPLTPVDDNLGFPSQAYTSNSRKRKSNDNSPEISPKSKRPRYEDIRIEPGRLQGHKSANDNGVHPQDANRAVARASLGHLPDTFRHLFSDADPLMDDASTPEEYIRNAMALCTMEQASREQMQKELDQERTARQATKKALDQALKERDQERAARESIEKARVHVAQGLLEATTDLRTRGLEWQERVDGLQETICDLGATIDRNNSDHGRQISDLVSKNDKIKKELEEKLQVYEAWYNKAIRTISELTDKLQKSEKARKDAIHREDQLQEKLRHCSGRLSEVDEAQNERLQQSEDRRNAALEHAKQLQVALDVSEAQRLEAEGSCKSTMDRAHQLEDMLRESESRRLEAEAISANKTTELGRTEAKLQETEAEHNTATQRADKLQNELEKTDESRRVEAAKFRDLETQVREGSKTADEATERLYQLQKEFALSEEQKLEAYIKIKELQDHEKQLRETDKTQTAELHTLREQLREADEAGVISTEEVARLRKHLTQSEDRRIRSEAQIAKVHNLRKRKLQEQQDEATGMLTMLKQLQDNIMMLEVSETAKRQRAEHAEEAQRRADAALDVTRAKLCDALNQQCQIKKHNEHLRECGTSLLAKCGLITIERDQALKARDDALSAQDVALRSLDDALRARDVAVKGHKEALETRDEALRARDREQEIASARTKEIETQLAQISKKYRGLEDASSIDKQVRAAQDRTAELVYKEILFDARKRFCAHRDLLGLAKLQPTKHDGWMWWRGLPDAVEHANLEKDLGPTNMAWLRIVLSLLKESEGVAFAWKTAAEKQGSLRLQLEQMCAKMETYIQALKRSMGHDPKNPSTHPYSQVHQPAPEQPNPQVFPQPPPHGYPPQGFPQGSPTQRFPPQGAPNQDFQQPPPCSQRQGPPSEGFPPQGAPNQGSQQPRRPSQPRQPSQPRRPSQPQGPPTQDFQQTLACPQPQGPPSPRFQQPQGFTQPQASPQQGLQQPQRPPPQDFQQSPGLPPQGYQPQQSPVIPHGFPQGQWPPPPQCSQPSPGITPPGFQPQGFPSGPKPPPHGSQQSPKIPPNGFLPGRGPPPQAPSQPQFVRTVRTNGTQETHIRIAEPGPFSQP